MIFIVILYYFSIDHTYIDLTVVSLMYANIVTWMLSSFFSHRMTNSLNLSIKEWSPFKSHLLALYFPIPA